MTEPTTYLLVCRVCSPDGDLVQPFASPAERGRWAAQHRTGTSHDRWWVHDGYMSPEQVAIAIADHDAIAARLP